MLNGHATYDQDYRPTNRTVSGVFNHTYATDDNGNITQKGSWTYAYDALNRLDEQDDSSTTTVFAYDAIGNRLSENDGSTTTYNYPSTSSKLSSVGSDSYTYDAMGNITDDAALAYTWSAAALLKEVKTSGTSTVLGAYTYDASNLRTKKVAGGNTVHYVYGMGGLLHGEYDHSGNVIREYVWLNGEPLAQVDAGSPEVLTYLHTDHLMTPRAGSNAAGSTVWTWESGAFGKEAATGTATVNLRFPGQYFDSEAGLHYNWNRYYNPAIGRYVSSDPIGLAGGLNTFAYAALSPVVLDDPEGLQGRVTPVPGPIGMCLNILQGVFSTSPACSGVAECHCIIDHDPYWCDKADEQKRAAASYPPASPGSSETCSGGACGPAGTTANESSTSLTPQQEAEKASERNAYHKICDTPPPQKSDPCENAKAKVEWHNRCLDAREAFTNKWYGGKYDLGHAEQMRQKRAALAKAKAEELVACAGRK